MVPFMLAARATDGAWYKEREASKDGRRRGANV
jgi:hypothetical protein